MSDPSLHLKPLRPPTALSSAPPAVADVSVASQPAAPSSEEKSEKIKEDIASLPAVLPSASSASGPGVEEEPAATPEKWDYPDGGWRAWKVVAGCFLFAMVGMGWGLTFGVFLTEYKTKVFPDTPYSVLSIIGGLTSFFNTSTAFVSGRLADRYGYKRVLIGGIAFIFVSFMLTAFSANLWQVIVTQGILIGIGNGITMPLYMSLPSRWFLKRRGLATGIAVSGSGFGGASNALIIQIMLPRIGHHYALLSYGFINCAIMAVALCLIETRDPPQAQRAEPRPWLPQGCWNDRVFYCLMACMIFSGFGFLSPYFYIGSYAQETVPWLANSTSIQLSAPLIVMNVVGGFGRILAGWLADRLGPTNVFVGAMLLSGTFQLVIWTLANSYGLIMFFSVAYGLVGGMFLSLLPVVCAQLFSVRGLATMVGFSTLLNSPGQFVGSTLAGAIKTASGGRWVPMILFLGSTLVIGGLFAVLARFGREKRVFVKF